MNDWLKQCNEWKEKWPVMQHHYRPGWYSKAFNLYAVLDAINSACKPDDVLMGDAGSISYAGPVALNSLEGQRLIFNPAQADMGWALPASIGVAAAGAPNVIAIMGDGSFMSNMQELAVIRNYQYNIKIVILNNGGYLSIKNTQQRFYEGRVFGTSVNKGLWFPKFEHIAAAFEIPYAYMGKLDDLLMLKTLLGKDSPYIIEFACEEDQAILPSQSFKNGKQAPLHDMAPFLDPEVLYQEMYYKDLI